jgi:hypothetical protein
VVSGLINQLHGDMEVISAGGLGFEISFKEFKYKDRSIT